MRCCPRPSQRSVKGYIDLQAQAERGARSNRDIACLSAMLSWLMRTQDTALAINPCFRVSGTRRDPERKRGRYVTHDEFRAIYDAARLQVRLLMDLTYRTLQRRESDIIRWTPANVTRDEHERRVIRHQQHNTKVMLKIALTLDLSKRVDVAMGDVPCCTSPSCTTARSRRAPMQASPPRWVHR